MKRSNKLLTGLLIAVFIVPLGLLIAFKQIVKKNDYTVINRYMHYFTSEKTGHYNTVKITVPEFKNTDSRRILVCRLHSAKEGRYTFRRFNIMDSIGISNESDTLFINYIIKPHPNTAPTYYVHYNIDLYLPDMKDIIVSGATLQMDSIDPAINPDIGIHLTDAIFQWGDGINKQDSNKPLKDLQESGFDKEKAPGISKYNRLTVSAEASQLIFGYHLQVDSLHLDIRKGSRLTIANDLQAHKINGTISDQATIISNIRTIKQLSSLNEPLPGL